MRTVFFLVVAPLFQSFAEWAEKSRISDDLQKLCDKDPTRGKVQVPKQQDQLTNVTISSSGGSRTFSLYMPPQSAKSRLPAVIHWHGYNSHYPILDYHAEVTKVLDQAQKSNYVVIMPLGTRRDIVPDILRPLWICDPANLKDRLGWNVPGLPGGASGVDDERFAEDILSYVKNKLSDRVDPSRVYTAGFSNGGFQAHRIGCKMSSEIAGVGVNAGSMEKGFLDECRKGDPVPVQSFHSRGDKTVYYNGRGLLWASQEEVIDMWKTRNGCSGSEEPQITSSTSSTLCQRWMCPGAPVELCTLDRDPPLTHCWIGGKGAGYTECNPQSADIDATAHMFEFWDFLALQASSNTSQIVV